MDVVSEANIVVNNVVLTPRMSKVVRLALTNFEREMQVPGVLGYDDIGTMIAKQHEDDASNILKLIFKKVKSDL